MDDRIDEHARVLVDHCTDIEAADDVLVKAPTAAEELVVALHRHLGRRGARPMVAWRNPRASREYLRAVDPDDLRTAEHERAAMAETDAVILIKAARNTAETGDVPRAVGAAASRANQPVLEKRLETRWVITEHPTAAGAQAAGMSMAGWEEYVYGAMLRDWEHQRNRQRRMADRLREGETIRLTVGERTDLSLSIAGMDAYNDDATENLPGGEVATVPIVDSAAGRFAVDFPVRRGGREIEGAWLEFEDGEVIDYGARRNEAALESVLDTDEGARRLGEFGIGTNPGVDRISHDTLFDEKMGGTVHVALGQAMAECVPADRTVNESSVHMDLLADVRETASLTIDGEPLQQNGEFPARE